MDNCLSHSQLIALATELGKLLLLRQEMLVTAESCTGGWVAEIVTSVSGSSRWFERGFVTYSNAAKQEMLGVSAHTIETFGAVSPQTAKEMAKGALLNSHAQLSLAITGIAGPDGGTADKPVGTVWFGWSSKLFGTIAECEYFRGDRYQIRQQAVAYALSHLIDKLKDWLD